MQKELEYFSKEFLIGIGTKSENFQKEFCGIIHEIDSYFYGENESLRKGLREYIENGISFEGSGRFLYSFSEIIPIDNGKFEFVMAVLSGIASEMGSEDLDVASAMAEASHFLIGIRAPENFTTSTFDTLVKDILCANRKPGNMPDILIITNTPKEGLPNGFFAAAIK